MKKRVVAFICQFSNEMVRSHLSLSNYKVENYIRKGLGHKPRGYVDRVIWVTEYIKGFELDAECEYHIISPHPGMKKLKQSFDNNGIHYHFVRQEPIFFIHYLNERFKVYQKNYYRRNRYLINGFISAIDPDLVVLCGAENPYYATSILDITNKPIFTILQSLRNNPKLMEFENNKWLLEAERRVLKHSIFFGGGGYEFYGILKGIVNNPIFLKLGFPQGTPPLFPNLEKESDFIFYAARIGKNKGIEDVLKAFKKIVVAYPSATLTIAGGCADSYQSYLIDTYILPENIDNNIKICGFFPKFEDVYKEVQKARIVVIPGISAALNGTVRESMQMGMPVIVYRTSATDYINNDQQRILTAEMENVDDLAEKMLYAYEHPKEMAEMAVLAKAYADVEYDSLSMAKQLVDDFKACMGYYYEGKPIPSTLLLEGNES